MKFHEIVKITMGQSPKSESYNNKGIGLPFLQGRTTFGRLHPYFDTWTTQYNKVANKGDILFTVRAPVGDINIANEEIAIGRGVAAITGIGISNKYLFYLIEGNKNKFVESSVGTIYDSINKDELGNVDLNVHDSKTQQHIVDSILFSSFHSLFIKYML